MRPNALALMALHHGPDGGGEQDLIAILDTGCNQTCHGDRWMARYSAATGIPMPDMDTDGEVRFRGISGQIRTAGMRKLQLCLELVNGGLAKGDIAGEVVHSQTLGHDLKLVCKDGLLGIRLLPGHLHGEGSDSENPDGAVNSRDPESDERRSEAAEAAEIETEIAYYTVDSEPVRVMNKKQKSRVKDGVENVRAKDRHMWSQIKAPRPRRGLELPWGCKTFLLEIFAGAAMLSQIACHEYGMRVSSPVDLNTGYDLLTKEGRDAVERVIERDDPFAISFAPVCTPWSSRTNILTGLAWEKVLMERKKWQPVIEWMYGIAEAGVADSVDPRASGSGVPSAS